MFEQDGGEPQEQQFTRWHNPTENVVMVAVWVGTQHTHRSGRTKFTWKPDEVKSVPSEYDEGIRQDDGSGHAPQLVKLAPGEEPQRRKKAEEPPAKKAEGGAKQAEGGKAEGEGTKPPAGGGGQANR